MTEEFFNIITERLDRIERMTLIGAKSVLGLDETVIFTGLSKGHLYRLTSEQRIPHYKKCRKLYFRKDDLEAWLLENRVNTNAEIDSMAATYIAAH